MHSSPPNTTSLKASSPLTVSQLNHQARYLLENQFSHIQVTGEISNLARPASGHLYFTLKDANAQIKVALFRSRLGRFIPSNGDKVVVTGKISLYEPRGDYQLIASGVQPAGEGDLQQAFLRLKAQLEQEGLFDPARKRPLPTSVQTIGVVTSATGAAIHDILTVLKRRFPGIAVILYPVAVQGTEASQQIARAIETANQWPQCDVLIVGRGGGSLEDLWAFNEEVVARAIVASTLPVVSAVGHEVDFTIADFAADLRAATPSAAAELLSPDRFELMQTFDHKEQQLIRALRQRITGATQAIQHLKNRLRHPGERIREQQKWLAQLQQRLVMAQINRVNLQKQDLSQLAARFAQQNPSILVTSHSKRVSQLNKQLVQSMQAALRTHSQRHQALARALNAVSPLATLERGYAIVRDEGGKAITRHQQLAVGQSISVRLHEGNLTATVDHIDESV